MRIKDMIGAMQLGKKKQVQVRELSTVWSEQADDGPQAVPLPEYPRPQLRRSDGSLTPRIPKRLIKPYFFSQIQITYYS